MSPSFTLYYLYLSGAFHVVSDPFRRPQDLYASIISPIGSFIDKAKVRLFGERVGREEKRREEKRREERGE